MNLACLGASGNVGRLVVRQLLSHEQVHRLVLVNRRVIEDGVLPDGDPRLVQHVVDMSSSEALERACVPLLRDVDVIVSTMGVGSGKGSAELFRRVEVELPSAFARAAKAAGVARAVLLTGVGSDIDSTSSWMVGGAAEGKFFHFKGLIEQRFTELAFPGGLAIFRPAGLLGTPHLPAWVDWLLPKLDWMAPARFRCMHIQRLAQAMASIAVHAAPDGNLAIFEGTSLFALVDGDRVTTVPEPPSEADRGGR